MSTPIKGIISFKTLRFGLQRLPKGSPTLRCHWVHISSQVASDLDADNPANSAAAIPGTFPVTGILISQHSLLTRMQMPNLKSLALPFLSSPSPFPPHRIYIPDEGLLPQLEARSKM